MRVRRIVGVIGVFLITIGTFLGAVWANESWGRYWGWDPKEIWSLITWLIYAIMLHARFVRGWRGKRMAVLANTPGSDGVHLQGGPEGARAILIAGQPLNEPIAQYGPFVMNTQQEIFEAVQDFQAGRLG